MASTFATPVLGTAAKTGAAADGAAPAAPVLAVMGKNWQGSLLELLPRFNCGVTVGPSVCGSSRCGLSVGKR